MKRLLGVAGFAAVVATGVLLAPWMEEYPALIPNLLLFSVAGWLATLSCARCGQSDSWAEILTLSPFFLSLPTCASNDGVCLRCRRPYRERASFVDARESA